MKIKTRLLKQIKTKWNDFFEPGKLTKITLKNTEEISSVTIC